MLSLWFVEAAHLARLCIEQLALQWTFLNDQSGMHSKRWQTSIIKGPIASLAYIYKHIINKDRNNYLRITLKNDVINAFCHDKFDGG
jgi:hypothetical protein